MGLLLDLSRPPEPTCGSTQDLCRGLALKGAPEGTVVWAREQTAGRGRMERGWASPRDQGLWLSFLLRPGGDPARWPALTAIVALALAEAVEALPQRPRIAGEPWQPGIKWPNDLYGRRGKLAGILAEVAGEAVVVGLGLNLRQRPEDFPPELAARATSLLMEGFDPAPAGEETASRLNEHLTGAYGCFQNGDRDFLRSGLRMRFYLRQARVELLLGTERVVGTAVDVGREGELILLTPGGLRSFSSGEIVRVRPVPPQEAGEAGSK